MATSEPSGVSVARRVVALQRRRRSVGVTRNLRVDMATGIGVLVYDRLVDGDYVRDGTCRRLWPSNRVDAS